MLSTQWCAARAARHLSARPSVRMLIGARDTSSQTPQHDILTEVSMQKENVVALWDIVIQGVMLPKQHDSLYGGLFTDRSQLKLSHP